jgi:hypothetical protein
MQIANGIHPIYNKAKKGGKPEHEREPINKLANKKKPRWFSFFL